MCIQSALCYETAGCLLISAWLFTLRVLEQKKVGTSLWNCTVTQCIPLKRVILKQHWPTAHWLTSQSGWSKFEFSYMQIKQQRKDTLKQTSHFNNDFSCAFLLLSIPRLMKKGLEGEVLKTHELPSLVISVSKNPNAYKLAWNFLRANWQELVKK